MKLLITSSRVGRVSPLRAGVTRRSSLKSAFTMVEIALCLAIIGFALVAIIGVLPVGLNVQKENREETIVNQDAGYFLDAIRNGARGLDDLTNYVMAITNNWTDFDANTNAGPSGYTGHTYAGAYPAALAQYRLNSGSNIVGLLSTPKIIFPFGTGFRSNHVVAYVRALSGAATEKFPQTNASVQDLAFTYRMIAEIVSLPVALPPDTNVVSAYSRALQANLHEVRLRFLWPLFPNGTSGNGRQTYRALVGGSLTNEPLNSPLWFFQPAKYAGNTP